jgi:hypothetical protein
VLAAVCECWHILVALVLYAAAVTHVTSRGCWIVGGGVCVSVLLDIFILFNATASTAVDVLLMQVAPFVLYSKLAVTLPCSLLARKLLLLIRIFHLQQVLESGEQGISIIMYCP